MEPEILDKTLLYAGFIYYRVRTVKSRTYWTCNRKGECSATAITFFAESGELVIAKGPLVTNEKTSAHDHPASPEEVQAEKVKRDLKKKADDNPEIAPAQILRTELPKVSKGIYKLINIRKNINLFNLN